MKIVALFVILAFAGCVDSEPNFERTCPQWVLGIDSYEPLLYWDPMDPGYYKEGRVIPTRPQFEGGTPDQLVMNFHANQSSSVRFEPHVIVIDGILEAYAFDNDTSERLQFRRGMDRMDSLSFESGEYRNFTVILEFNHPDAQPFDRNVRIDWQFFPNVDQNPETPSAAEVAYVGHIAYKVC